MRNLSDTIARLTALRNGAAGALPGGEDDRLHDLADFGSNPGALRARIHVPEGLGGGAPLVVVLHGCTQTAADYDIGAGWSDMADRHGFAVLLPEQQRANNPNLCFNWFSPEDSRRGSGEALSIRQMIAAMAERYAIDPARIFVTGLSAGGAMASAMLATYPELFAGGAIVAGLPYGCASSVPDAFDRMRGHGIPGEARLARLVRDASDHEGAWPIVSVWHGTADATVHPANGEAVVAQWRGVHGVGARPDRTDRVDGYPHRVWRDRQGRPVVEAFEITGLGHGTPLATSGEEGCGQSGPFMLEAAISSTHHICRFWGLLDEVREPVRDEPARRALQPVVPKARRLYPERSAPASSAMKGVGEVIEDALRAAGLMR